MKGEPDEICLADTSGMANPIQVKKLVRCVQDIAGSVPLSLHLVGEVQQEADLLGAVLLEGQERPSFQIEGHRLSFPRMSSSRSGRPISCSS
jgi:hypothetical protein